MNPQDPKFCFHMVQAEVIFTLGESPVTSRRIQFFAKGEDDQFSAMRLTQIQNAAAMSVAQKMKLTVEQSAQYRVLEVLLHALHPCGYMTDLDFYGAGGPDQVMYADTGAPAVVVEATPEGGKTDTDNVVPIRPDSTN